MLQFWNCIKDGKITFRHTGFLVLAWGRDKTRWKALSSSKSLRPALPNGFCHHIHYIVEMTGQNERPIQKSRPLRNADQTPSSNLGAHLFALPPYLHLSFLLCSLCPSFLSMFIVLRFYSILPPTPFFCIIVSFSIIFSSHSTYTFFPHHNIIELILKLFS